ncbi:F0F1 ATP synthase subunit delta [Alteribacillus sp. HJP-4]|uniref:F0F1 ATP synthase subunit delta n=1 Tax=Alteribacillus sp. HJP-4 TaxID=2775394 RepID=UPI0035CD2264
MSSSVAANRYAVALFELAKEKGVLDTTRAELEAVKQIFQEDDQLNRVLYHPNVSPEKKQELLRTAFSSLSDIVVHTLLLLQEKKRLNAVVQTAEAFIDLVDEEQKRGYAVVTSVKPLTDNERALISEKFAQRAGKATLHIENIIDRDLIGGLRIRIGDTIYDGSVKSQLNRLEHQMISGKR